MRKVLIIGSRGMLATAMAKEFSADNEVETYIAGRHYSKHVSPERTTIFHIEEDRPEFPGMDYIINCAGIIKPYIDESDPVNVQRAIFINALFPHRLASMNGDTPIVQIATDCVYAGTKKSSYLEVDEHDALDVYGKTKSLGEVRKGNFFNIRSSIVGPEEFNRKSLLAWFLAQPSDSTLTGFINHQWNGLTTKAFSRVCLGLVKSGLKLPSWNIHLTPADTVSKYELLNMFQSRFGTNYNIASKNAPISVNRVLKSQYSNDYLWKNAGYDRVPTISEMIKDL
jgi:dTDP-4-dehydrorhamnose reductase